MPKCKQNDIKKNLEETNKRRIMLINTKHIISAKGYDKKLCPEFKYVGNYFLGRYLIQPEYFRRYYDGVLRKFSYVYSVQELKDNGSYLLKDSLKFTRSGAKYDMIVCEKPRVIISTVDGKTITIYCDTMERVNKYLELIKQPHWIDTEIL